MSYIVYMFMDAKIRAAYLLVMFEITAILGRPFKGHQYPVDKTKRLSYIRTSTK